MRRVRGLDRTFVTRKRRQSGQASDCGLEQHADVTVAIAVIAQPVPLKPAMGWFTFQRYAAISFHAALGVVWHAFATRRQCASFPLID